MAFEGAILDFDGTLVDSIDAWHDLEGVLAREAQATVTLEDRKQLIPMSLDEIAQWFHGRFGLGKDARAVRNLMDEYMVDALSHSKALPGVEAFLESCKRADVKLTVASSSPQLYLQTALKALGLLPYFEAVLSVEDLGTTKRQPGIFEEARWIMATPKEATWGFDDSFYALQVLHNAGYPTVGIFDPHEGYTFEEWQQEADIVVRGFNELSLATLEAYPVKNEQKN